ncbi:MAG: hypothetical protein COA96_16775 [SAR86 cluster bacterium]|uniref:Uncharacterized protein n=1 Tax=SAR86 cluster bacterium TaxID=2030880 RepID=A0A2A5AG54_9GAMM|nr:MAG: hypothetical protein COA96_16775 [SAR86 cluster bacterium]
MADQVKISELTSDPTPGLDAMLEVETAAGNSRRTTVQEFVNEVGIPTSNYTATTAPTPDDDTTQGYAVGSDWFDLTADWYYHCIDATAGAALWIGHSRESMHPLVHPSSVKAASITFAGLTGSTRRVDTVNVGPRRNKQRQIIKLFTSSAVDAEIEAMESSATSGDEFKDQQILTGANNGGPPIAVLIEAGGISEGVLVATPDYNGAMRGEGRAPASGRELYGAGAGTDMPFGWNYAAMNVGVLVGWYGVAAGGGFALINKHVQLESVWLTQSGADTIINFALFNSDVSTSAAKTIKIGVYE